MAKVAKEINGVPISISGSYVESVTGALVDNTDPLNPIVNTPDLTEVLTASNDAGTLVIENAGDAVNPQDLPTYKQMLDNDYSNFFVEVVAIVNQNLAVQTVDGVAGKLNALFTAQTSAADNGFYGWNGVAWVKYSFPFYSHETEYSFLSKNIFSANFGSTVGSVYLQNAGFANYTFNKIGTSGVTNLGYTASPTNGIVTSDTGTDATIPLATGTDAGLLSPAQKTLLDNTSGTNSGDNATNTTSNSYADAKVADAINDGTTTIAPSQNAVFDALALKQDTLTETNFGNFINARTAKNTLVDADEVVSDDSADSNKAKKTTWANVWTNYLLVKLQAATPTLSNLWTFLAGLTISGGRLTFATGTTTASGSSLYLSTATLIKACINSVDVFEFGTTLRSKVAHYFDATIFTNLTPTAKSVAVINTDNSVSADYIVETAYMNISAQGLAAIASTTTETELTAATSLGDNTFLAVNNFANRMTAFGRAGVIGMVATNTYTFAVRFGPAATAFASRTVVATTGAISAAALTAQGWKLDGIFSIKTHSATATVNCSFELKVNGQAVVVVSTVTSASIDTTVDNVLTVTIDYGTSSASNTCTLHQEYIYKLS